MQKNLKLDEIYILAYECHKKSCTKQSIAYGYFLMSRYEAKNKNHEKEFKFLKKGHKIFFDSKQKEFENKINYWLNEISNIKKIKFEQNNI